jgi:hypothetical protein
VEQAGTALVERGELGFTMEVREILGPTDLAEGVGVRLLMVASVTRMDRVLEEMEAATAGQLLAVEEEAVLVVRRCNWEATMAMEIRAVLLPPLGAALEQVALVME